MFAELLLLLRMMWHQFFIQAAAAEADVAPFFFAGSWLAQVGLYMPHPTTHFKSMWVATTLKQREPLKLI